MLVRWLSRAVCVPHFEVLQTSPRGCRSPACLVLANMGTGFLFRSCDHSWFPCFLSGLPTLRGETRLERNLHSSPSLPQKSTDDGSGSLSTLTGQTRSRKGHLSLQEVAWQTGTKEGSAGPSGEVKGPRPGVWEVEQAWARTNQVGHVSPSCAKKTSSPRRGGKKVHRVRLRSYVSRGPRPRYS